MNINAQAEYKKYLTCSMLTFYFQLYADKYTQSVETMMVGMHIYSSGGQPKSLWSSG